MKNDKEIIKNIKFLACDAIQQANSGHPGIVLGFASAIYILFKNHLNFNIKEPTWKNRDRFILSAGHGSALLYSTLYFFGYDINIDDIKNFRQLNSKTPGHPEIWDIPGIEVTSGPLGQGISMAVGMAISEKYLNSNILLLNKKKIFDNYTYVICSDGDLQEGISYEAMSLAGHMKLSKLIVIFDSNHVQLDSYVNKVFSEDIKKRVTSQEWDYYHCKNVNDLNDLNEIISKAKLSLSKRPKFIEVNSIIGQDSVYANSCKSHGAPFSDENYENLRSKLNWNHKRFYINNEYKNIASKCLEKRSLEKYKIWEENISNFQKENPKIAELILHKKKLNINYKELIANIENNGKVATREICGVMLNYLFNANPLFIGGSADLAGSTKVSGANGFFSLNNLQGREIPFGIREAAMASVVVGIRAYNVLYSYGSTFLVFADYSKAQLRMAALMKQSCVFFYSHDSIWVGEDGPTHEPIEQLDMLRNIPFFTVWRPCNKYEMAAAIKHSFEKMHYPSVIISSRQNFKQIGHKTTFNEILNGAYIIQYEQQAIVDVVILATGSEVPLACEVANNLFLENNYITRVISVPSIELFENTNAEYQNEILNLNSTSDVYVIEASRSYKWCQFTKKENIFGLNSFGESGKGVDVANYFGFNSKTITAKILYNLKTKQR